MSEQINLENEICVYFIYLTSLSLLYIFLVNWVYTWIQFWYIHFPNTFRKKHTATHKVIFPTLENGWADEGDCKTLTGGRNWQKLPIENIAKIFWVHSLHMEMIGNINNHNCTRDTLSLCRVDSQQWTPSCIEAVKCKTIKSFCVKTYSPVRKWANQNFTFVLLVVSFVCI